MSLVRIAVGPDDTRARVTLSAGVGATLVPRLIGRTGDSARVALVAGGALILGGDHIDLDIRVGPNCTLDLTEVGGTVAYDAEGEQSWWAARVQLDADATLIWRGLELVISDGANLHRRTDLVMAKGARALIREVSVLGRTGERGGRLLLENSVTIEDAPLLVESVDVSGDQPVPGVLSDYRVLESILLAGTRPDEVDAHTMELAGPGLLARRLAHAVHDSPIDSTWASWRAHVGARR